MFFLFANMIRHCNQYINEYFTKSNLAYIRQTPRFLFRFLGINLEKKILCHDLYCDMRVNANNFWLMAKPWNENKHDRRNRPNICDCSYLNDRVDTTED